MNTTQLKIITQLKNIFIYTGIMLIDNQIILSSPDYLKEKTLKFFGCLGKPEFIQFPKIKYNTQKLNIPLLIDPTIQPNINFWTAYCLIWNIKNDDYELMNIINFLLNILPPCPNMKPSITINSFQKYIGNIESITTTDLSYMAHAKLREYFVENIKLNDRYCKLRILKSME